MEITVDDLQDWQQGHEPTDLMDTIVAFLTENEGATVQVNYADGEQHSNLLKMNNQIVQVGAGDGFVEGGSIYDIPE